MENTKTMEIQEKSESPKGNSKNTAAKVGLILERVLVYVFLFFNVAICLFFFYILIVNATMSKDELHGVFTGLPSTHFFDNLETALFHPENIDVLKGTFNSLIVASLTALASTYFSALSAYAIHAYRFKGRKFIASFILAIMMIPAQVSSLGFFQLAYQLGAKDQLWILIVPSIAAPSVYFYMLQYLKSTLPLDLVEASRIDGSSEFMTFNRVVLPLMKPALAVQGIFTFVASWNNLYIPSLLLTDDNKKTLPVLLATLASKSISQSDAGQVWMVTLLAILPIVIVYLLLSKYIIKGVTSGSVKG